MDLLGGHYLSIINLIMFPVIWIETLRSFGKNPTWILFLAIVTFGLYIISISYQKINYEAGEV
jgi:signal peptidase I